jgi:hypothetical protein
VVRANSPQYGHCMSAYSTSVTGALGDPSVPPCCGMPASRAAVWGPIATVVAGVEGLELLPLTRLTPTSTATAAIPTAAAPTYIRSRVMA